MHFNLASLCGAVLATAALGQTGGFTLQSALPVYQSGSVVDFSVSGAPGTPGVLLVDTDPGPTTIPGIGTFQVGFSSALRAVFLPSLPPSGSIAFCDPAPCPPAGSSSLTLYFQAASISPSATIQISNPISMRFEDPAGFCAPAACRAAGSIASNFNGTKIAEGCDIWFNANAKIQNLGMQAGTFRFTDAKIAFSANGTSYDLDVPDSVIIVSPLVPTPRVFFHQASNEWRISLPLGATSDIFWSGLAFAVPSGGLPGGINPVTWSGEFSSNVPGVSAQWKWGAAVYCPFSHDYNRLGVRAIHGSGLQPGTPEAFKTNVVGGARGGGGSNFTGSWSGTKTIQC